MLFLPYKIDSQKRGFPLITTLICLLCLLIYAEQYASLNRYLEHANEFCAEPLDSNTQAIIDRVNASYPNTGCNWIFEVIREASDRDAVIDVLVAEIEPLRLFASVEDDRAYMASRIAERSRRYELFVPRAITHDLAYDPANPSLRHMVTSTFSHADIPHLLGNLLFFFVFGASVELIIGYLGYALFIGVVTVGTGIGYSYAMLGVENALPTIGLSGVVMATLAALGVMMPRVRIRCFFWFIWIFRIFRVPVYMLALWYVAWDFIDLNRLGVGSSINYASHLAGAFLGAAIGLAYVMFAKSTILEAAAQYEQAA